MSSPKSNTKRQTARKHAAHRRAVRKRRAEQAFPECPVERAPLVIEGFRLVPVPKKPSVTEHVINAVSRIRTVRTFRAMIGFVWNRLSA